MMKTVVRRITEQSLPFNPDLIVMTFIILLFEWIIVRLQGVNL